LLEILYQDEHLVAINKPSGLLVHRSPIDRHETEFAVQILRNQLGRFVYPIHRLDKPTSGVLIFALDKESAKIMGETFMSHEAKKSYIAVVRGYVEESAVIDYALSIKLDKIADKNSSTDKEPQEATTHYERLATVELDFKVGKYDKTRYSLVRLNPLTGRKHQLRRHMKHISHHILGDTKYGRGEHNILIRQEFGCHRMLLHALELHISHPHTKEQLSIKAPLDNVFKDVFNSFGWNESLV